MKHMVRMEIETFDYVDEQEKPETYNREYNKQKVLEVCIDAGCASALTEHLQAALKPRLMRSE